MSEEVIEVVDASDASSTAAVENATLPAETATQPTSSPTATAIVSGKFTSTLSSASLVKNRIRPKVVPTIVGAPMTAGVKRMPSKKAAVKKSPIRGFAATLLRARSISVSKTNAVKRRKNSHENRSMVHANAILHNLALKYNESPTCKTTEAVTDDSVTYSLDQLSDTLGTKDPRVVAAVFRPYEKALKALFALFGQVEDDDEPQIIEAAAPPPQRLVYVTSNRHGAIPYSTQRNSVGSQYQHRYLVDPHLW